MDRSVRIGKLMRRGWVRAALAAALMMTLAPAVRAQQHITLAGAVHTASIRVTVGKTEDVRTDQNFTDITVGDPDIADVSPLTDHSLSILGKKIGTTRVTVYDPDHKAVGIFDIEVSYDISRLAVEISHFTGGGIKVSSINGRIMLSGTSPDAATLDKAVQIASQFGPDPINTVQVMQPQQIELEVRFIEVDRNAGRDLGVQWNAFGNSALANVGSGLPAQQLPITAPGGSFQQPGATVGGPSVLPSSITGTPLSPVVAAGVLSGAAPFGFLVGQLSNKLQIEVNALESKGAARLLAEPNLVTLSGETASFLAGGQIPIPEVGATGTPSFGFQPYGVGLSFTPTVLRNGVINLIVKPEVSEIDKTNGVTVAGTFVPGLTTRKASTTLELRDGQSFMLGGLLQSDGTNNIDQLPWLGDMPVLGALFRSTDYQKQETDLVILVTPHIVRPLAPTDPVHTPFDSSLPPNDVDLFLMGDTEVSPELARLAIGALNRPYVGHILDLPKNGGVYVSVKD
ncbi:MAG TPA: type II and III secretion system protein family protein [Xanthobacteraceae bacterium]|nr:type II and III secretion system protein family protein [Xanthobacteraceae bacterium]